MLNKIIKQEITDILGKILIKLSTYKQVIKKLLLPNKCFYSKLYL